MILKPHDILISISETDRDKLFNKRLKSPTGEFITDICVELAAEFGTDPAYSQDVQIAEVLQVGSEVKGIGIGDNVIVDYLVDTTEDYTVEQEWASKTCILDTRTLYYQETKQVPANRKTNVNTFVYKKGEMERYSLVIAIIKGNTIIPNHPYIFLEHKLPEGMAEVEGIVFIQTERQVVERKVLFTALNSNIKPGLFALIESDFIFQRKIGEHIFDVCFESDIIGSVEVNLE
jgi:hypothetical protein